MSCLTTSATRRSRSVPAAVLTASAAASSHEVLLVPMISVTLYTLITLSFDHVGPLRGAAVSLSQSHPARSMQAGDRRARSGRPAPAASPVTAVPDPQPRPATIALLSERSALPR